MLTRDDNGTDAGRDDRPVLRRGWDGYGHWVKAVCWLFPAFAVGLLLLSPLLAVLVLAGLVATVARYVATGDVRALARIAAGFWLWVAGYHLSRLGVAFDVSTVREWASSARLAADGGDDLSVAFVNARVAAVYLVVLAVAFPAALAVGYALIRPYRTRWPSGLVFAGCLVVGAAAGILS